MAALKHSVLKKKKKSRRERGAYLRLTATHDIKPSLTEIGVLPEETAAFDPGVFPQNSGLEKPPRSIKRANPSFLRAIRQMPCSISRAAK